MSTSVERFARSDRNSQASNRARLPVGPMSGTPNAALLDQTQTRIRAVTPPLSWTEFSPGSNPNTFDGSWLSARSAERTSLDQCGIVATSDSESYFQVQLEVASPLRPPSASQGRMKAECSLRTRPCLRTKAGLLVCAKVEWMARDHVGMVR